METLQLNTKNSTADTNMTNLETFIQLQSEVTRTTNELYAFLRDKKKDLILDIAKELKAIPGMNKIIIKGYTPGFNDGDACTHSSEVYYNKRYDFGEIAEYGIYGLAEFLGAPEEFVDEEDELYNWDEINNVNTYDDADEGKVKQFISLLDDLIEKTYYTDYIVYIDLTTDEPTITHEDYDCGY